MLTLFTTPKAFLGHIGIIQRNALTSWTLLRPRPEILIFGNDAGAAEVAHEFGLRHIPEVACTRQGTPQIGDMFRRAQNLAANPLLGYVNADLILLSDFPSAVEAVASWRERFLMVGNRWDLDIAEPWNFQQPEPALRELARQRGTRRGCSHVDYFVFPKGLYCEIPPFAIGRTRWDHWLVWYAESRGVPIVDASKSVVAIHQNHDYYHAQGPQGIWSGEEAQENWRLAKDGTTRTIEDATHKLGNGRVRPNIWHWAAVVKRVSRQLRGKLR